MKTYKVLVKEVWVCHVLVNASSPEEAIKVVALDQDFAYEDEGTNAEWGETEYSHTQAQDTWTVEPFEE